MKNIVLAKDYSIKGDNLNKFLLDIRTGRKYNLNEKQFRILSLCNGTLTSEGIARGNDVSIKDINVFLGKLKGINAIEFCNKKERKDFIYITQGRQLKEIHWEITNLCNLNCLHCYQVEYLRKERDFSLDECRGIIKEMAKLGVEKVSISGGEPLMRKDFLDILKLLQSENIKVQSIFTNGILISDELLEGIKTLKLNPRFNISLDGIKAESLKIRGLRIKKQQLDYLNKVFKNILLLQKKGFQVRINTIMNKMNYLEMEKMYHKLSRMGQLSWSIGFPREIGSCVLNRDVIAIDTHSLLRVCKNLIQIHLNKNKRGSALIDLKIQNLFHKKFLTSLEYYSPESCVCNYENRESAICLKSNGDLLPCSVLFNYVMGNIKVENLYDVWNSNKMKEFKGIKIKELEKCNNCRYMNLCGGGCRATASILMKNVKSYDPLACEFMDYFFREIKPLLC